MEDMADKISKMLNDPEGITKIMNMAKTLFSEGEKDEPQTALAESTENPGGLLGLLPDGVDPIKLINIFSALNSNQNDNRASLLLALKPHLSSERQPRVEKAVKLLKIASLLPVLKENGLLDII